jgi:effector-binding domain-containing protein
MEPVQKQGQVEVADAAARQSVAIRSVLPMEGLDIGALFNDDATRLVTYLEQHDIEPAGPPYARYREFGPDRADVEIGIPVDADLEDLRELAPDQVIGISELPGGRVARVLHEGAYDGLGSAYQRLEGFIAEQGTQTAGAPWESYVVMPDGRGDPTSIRTEVCWPLA